MKINAAESQVEFIGDIKEFKTGIDPKNLEFITTLLSSNLYSAPERSFIREIVSNAWDSHVEAGTTDVPVLVKIGTDSVTIRDFGTGLSPERFEEVYCNIGSSTKRDSNDYIGGFGIGKFASLAVSNTVQIVSYYQGKAYHYMMVKDGNRITNNLIMALDTEEKDGVEVTVKNLRDISKYYKALSYIIFFPNVYVDGVAKSEADKLNNTKIKYWTNFACASTAVSHKLLLGNVLYPLDVSAIKPTYSIRQFVDGLDGTGLVIRFSIGEIEVTPNRESIIYSDKTIALINKRLKEAEKEINSYIANSHKLDYQDVFKWAEAHDTSLRYDFFEDVAKPCNRYAVGYPFTPLSCNSRITFKGKVYDGKYARTVKTIIGHSIPWLRGVITEDRIYQNANKLPYRLYNSKKMGYDKLLLLPSSQRMFRPIKEYLKEKYEDYAVISEFSFDDFVNYLSDPNIDVIPPKNTAVKDNNLMEVLREVYTLISDRAVTIDFDTDQDYLTFKDGLKEEKVKLAPVKNFYLYVWKGYNHDNNYCSPYVQKNYCLYKTLEEAIAAIRKIQKGVVFDNISPSNENFANIVCSKDYYYITAAIPVLNELRKIQFTNVVDKWKMLNEDKDFLKLAYLYKYHINAGLSPYVTDTVPEPLRSEVKVINAHYNKYVKWRKLVEHVTSLDLPENEYYKELAEKLLNYKELFENIQKEYGVHPDASLGGDLTAALLIKTKAYRVSKETYARVKSNKIIQTLWQKSLRQAV